MYFVLIDPFFQPEHHKLSVFFFIVPSYLFSSDTNNIVPEFLKFCSLIIVVAVLLECIVIASFSVPYIYIQNVYIYIHFVHIYTYIYTKFAYSTSKHWRFSICSLYPSTNTNICFMSVYCGIVSENAKP